MNGGSYIEQGSGSSRPVEDVLDTLKRRCDALGRANEERAVAVREQLGEEDERNGWNGRIVASNASRQGAYPCSLPAKLGRELVSRRRHHTDRHARRDVVLQRPRDESTVAPCGQLALALHHVSARDVPPAVQDQVVQQRPAAPRRASFDRDPPERGSERCERRDERARFAHEVNATSEGNREDRAEVADGAMARGASLAADLLKLV